MSVDRYALGVVLLALVTTPLALGSVRLRRRLLPEWSGPPARLAEALLAVAGALLLAQALGAVGLLRDWAFVAGAVLVGGVAGRLGWSADRPAEGHGGEAAAGDDPRAVPPAPGRGAFGRLTAVVGWGVGLLLAAQWTVPLQGSLRVGMSNGDTLSYHLPFAARFFQEGSITGLHFLSTEPLTTFYPAHASLLHAGGMLLFERDVLSPLLNLAWLGLALLAAWCVGRPHGVPTATLLGAALTLGLPILATTQAGEGTSDAAGLALVLTSVALVVNAGGRRAAIVLAAVAAGLAVGTKVTFAVPVLALGLAVVAAAPRGRRGPTAALWVLAAAATGGVWYLRNLVWTGNPLPWVGLDLGPLSLPSPPTPRADDYRFTVLHYATDFDIWRDAFVPSLEVGLGPLWWVVLGLAAAGSAAALLAARARLLRLFGAAVAVSAAAYVVTPQSAGGPEGSPGLFLANLRFLTPALVLGLVVLPLVPALRATARRSWPVVAYGVVAAVTILASDPLDDSPARAVAAALAAAVVVLALERGLPGRLRAAPWRRAPRRAALGAGLACAAVVGAGFVAQREYLDRRYTGGQGPLGPTFRWAQGVHDARIAIAGTDRQYPLYGRDLSNVVQYVGRRGPHGGFSPYRRCEAWRRALRRGGFDYVVTAPVDFPVNAHGAPTPEAAWTRTDPGASEIIREGTQVSVFRLNRPPSPGDCAGA